MIVVVKLQGDHARLLLRTIEGLALSYALLCGVDHHDEADPDKSFDTVTINIDYEFMLIDYIRNLAPYLMSNKADISVNIQSDPIWKPPVDWAELKERVK